MDRMAGLRADLDAGIVSGVTPVPGRSGSRSVGSAARCPFTGWRKVIPGPLSSTSRLVPSYVDDSMWVVLGKAEVQGFGLQPILLRGERIVILHPSFPDRGQGDPFPIEAGDHWDKSHLQGVFKELGWWQSRWVGFRVGGRLERFWPGDRDQGPLNRRKVVRELFRRL